MWRLFGYLAAAALAWHVLATTSRGQLVEVRPGYVRAPFVEVYRGPYGESSVRAPFVNRYSPGFRSRYESSAALTDDSFTRLNWSELSQRIRQSCKQLEADLSRNPSGDFWKSNLKTAEIAELVFREENVPPVESVRRRLAEILATYNSVAEASDINRVAEFRSFQVLHVALNEYVTLPEARLRRQLAADSRDLHQSLGRLTTGAGWRDYLLVSPNMPLSAGRLWQDTSVSTTELADALARFDSANLNEEYQRITSLPAFKTMHVGLAAYFDERQSPSTPPAEELLTPAPTPRR